MITEELMRKFTRVTKDEMEKAGILVKMPERSKIADIHQGHTWTIDVLADTADGLNCSAQVLITDLEIKGTTHDAFFRMLNTAIRRVSDYRDHVAQYVADHPNGDAESAPALT